jgi:site-specific recombinase XerD
MQKGRTLPEGQHALDAALACEPCDRQGMPIEIAQQNLGHASLATTTVYVTTEKRRRMKAVEAFLEHTLTVVR